MRVRFRQQRECTAKRSAISDSGWFESVVCYAVFVHAIFVFAFVFVSVFTFNSDGFHAGGECHTPYFCVL
jgi:hypothetical protein